MVEAQLPWLRGEPPEKREHATLNPRTAEFFEAPPEAPQFIRDRNGMVRAPVYRTLSEAHQAGANPRTSAPIPAVTTAPMDELIETPIWLRLLGWAGLVAVVAAVPIGIWATRRAR